MDERKLILDSDYHTHTTYSHGRGSVYDNAVSAKEKGLIRIAITDHAINHPIIGVSPLTYNRIRKDIDIASKAVDLEILMGIEGNLIGEEGKIDVKPKDISRLDILLAGFHLTAYKSSIKDYFGVTWNGVTKYIKKSSQRQIAQNTRMYINALKNNSIDILTHVGFRLDVDHKAIAQACSDYGTYVELSTRHKTPNAESIQPYIDSKCMFVINSDAHKPKNIAKWDFSLDLVKQFNIPVERIANAQGNKLEIKKK